MKRFAILALVISSATASALVTRATYLKKNAFRDAPPICFKSVDPGQGNPVTAFDVTVTVCPQADPAQLESPSGLPCQTLSVPGYAATSAQKNWVKSAWSAANVQAQVPEALQDAP